MKRVVNELTADEVHRHGGTKIGDFGTGGRTYSYYSRGATKGEKATGRLIFAGIFALIGVALLWYVEKDLYQTIGCIHEAEATAVQVPQSQYDPRNNNELVYTTSSDPKLEGPPVVDSYFEMDFTKDDGAVKRVTEYCQWMEFTHTKKTLVGRESNCQRNDDSCNIYRTDKAYTYHKGWRSHLISSAFFDSPAAYHNPQRDPAPSKKYSPTGLLNLGGGLHVAPVDVEGSMAAWATVPLFKSTASEVSQEAYNAGFTEADHRFYYSRVAKDGMDHPLAKAAFSYLVDGVLDVNQISAGTGVESVLDKAGLGWITRGTCNAGDIRVHFEVRTIPSAISLVGRQAASGGVLVPNSCKSGGSMIISLPGLMGLDALLKKALSDAQWWTNVYRVGIILLLFIAGFVLKENPFGATYVTSLCFLLVHVYVYGFGRSILDYLLVAITIAAFAGEHYTLAKGSEGSEKSKEV